MRKSMKAVWKHSKKNNFGLTMIELIVAIAILGIISGTVAFIMISSSRSYRTMSVEAQLQSEAQLVANAISELAIDSYDASCKLDGLAIGAGYNTADGQVLLLSSKAEDTTKQYVLALKETEKELYLAERTYDESSGTWSGLSEFSLLGDNVRSFVVDDSRVKQDNVLLFELKYERDGRVYEGNYQILMRNKAYADEKSQEDEENGSTSLVLTLNPKIVYLDVVNMNPTPERPTTIPYYYINNVSEGTGYPAAGGVQFISQAVSNRALDNRGVSWSLSSAPAAFYMSDGVDQVGQDQKVTNTLRWNAANLTASDPDSFSVSINKEISNPDGTGTIQAQEKTAIVMLRRVKKITLNASGGATKWINQYDEFGGRKSVLTDNYAYADMDGKYVNMTINANIEQSNVAFGGGLRWELFKGDETGTNWGPCSDSFAKLLSEGSETSTSTQIEFGTALENGQIYKVVATSLFDDTVSNEFIFGVAPKGAGSNSGFHSRGFYVDLSSYVKMQPGYENVSISKMRKGAVSDIFSDGSDIRVEKGANGRWYLYVSYDAFAGTGQDKSRFYSETGTIQIHITRTDNTEEDTATIEYTVNPVYVDKMDHPSGVIVLQKGKDENVNVNIEHYNVIARKYFGIYLEDLENNINSPGLADSNRYISTSVVSSYGDEHNYVDVVTTSLKAKASVRDYNPNPMMLRLTADDYYVTSDMEARDSYEEYAVYVANVEDTEVFISTPNTTTGDCKWPEGVGTANKVSVNGYDANGNLIADIAQVYVAGNSYRCDYMGSTYTYNRTYHYWYK